MILDIVRAALGLGGDWLEGRRKLKQTRIEAETKVIIARAEAEATRLGKAQDAEIAWDNSAVNQMSSSWKDEYLTILLTIPVILAFCGEWGRKAAKEGFEAIATVPEWYMVSFMAAIAASFGVRALVDRFGLRKS
jgi:hypothetical protein